MLKINSLTLFLLVLSTITISAQKWRVGISTGVALYQGDLTEQIAIHSIKNNKPTVGGFVHYQINEKFSLRANYLQGEISANEGVYHKIPWRVQRGFSFKSPITEVSTVVEWDFLKWKIGKKNHSKKQFLSLCVVGGLGYVKTKPQVDFNEPNPMFEDVNIDKLAQYNRNHLVVPMGIGVKWHISPNKTLSLEGANRTTFTDYLDGVSKTAQPKYGDWYLIGTLSFSQQLTWGGKNNYGNKRGFNASVSCPKFK